MKRAAGAVPGRPVRTLHPVNWLGLWALVYRRGLVRYFRYGVESIGGPTVSGLLFLAVFSVAAGPRQIAGADVTIAVFVAPGIALFMVANCAFENAAATIVYEKHEGIIADLLMAPLSALEILAGYVIAATLGALSTGAVVTALLAVLIDLPLSHLGVAAGFALAAAVFFALLGTIVGLWADRWDHYAAAESFLVLPLSLLSGAFFSLEAIPAEIHWIFMVNPVFYAIDGFRYGFIDFAESSLWSGAAILAGLNLCLGLIAWRLLLTGYKVKP